MSNIIDMVTSIIEGASDIELSTLTARAVIELNRRAGRRKWELVDEAEHGVVQVEPTKTKTKTTKRKGGGGKSSSPFWVKTLTITPASKRTSSSPESGRVCTSWMSCRPTHG